jgi:hypothetical protein
VARPPAGTKGKFVDHRLPEQPYAACARPALARDRVGATIGPMHLVEFLLPTFDNEGRRFPKDGFDRVRQELIERFGGVTAFLRSPATGLWADEGGQVRRDDLAIFEVMVDTLDRAWWRQYREQLERRFRQKEVVMRATEVERL